MYIHVIYTQGRDIETESYIFIISIFKYNMRISLKGLKYKDN